MAGIVHPSQGNARSGSRPQGQANTEDASPVVRLLAALLGQAVESGASDLHFEPDHDGLRVRLRIDGQLRDLEPPPPLLVPALLTRVRLLARVDLAERRLPQDGRFAWTPPTAGPAIDVRASFLPVARGEKIALRLLRPSSSVPSLDALGPGERVLALLTAALARPNGLVLVVGPTGSGKSTTLQSSLLHLRRTTRSLVTVEDPVEFDTAGVSQVAVDEDAGRTFAVVLRALLRQDPDVLMVGEIRDEESARIACRAALTGHLVLSSLHAADAREAFLRLPEFGVPEALLRGALSLVVAQRLVRALCSSCRGVAPASPAAAAWFRESGLAMPGLLPAPAGCRDCHGTGYRGRLALFEAASGAADAPLPFAPRSLGAEGLACVLQQRSSFEEVLLHCPHPQWAAQGVDASGHGGGAR